MNFYNDRHYNRLNNDYDSDGRRKTDFGGEPHVTNICKETGDNSCFRRALWTGTHLQTTLMSVSCGEEIGWETHSCADQMICIVEGKGIVRMSMCSCGRDIERQLLPGDAVFIPAGTRHSVSNNGRCALKLFSVYAPPQHPYGTIHRTASEAEESEKYH